ncbi:ComF family protein [Mucilaginibacter myungsuensis]|uniref:ComF family protein n=1 Tax=Mucilaginibacter myungsuensis TaxID=649104 RepID=A0A929L0I0_9SPHI|nr:phosphoribosyltransferase family protein [Mucilaginibacter myungsuensis]MBE9664000.1 ComF family protein [Mucilaginibacter myungsuensis]MDN3601179.1 phosphoribosyltransferase family protein [Mucilaginibacter myungsuensis]
MNFLRRYWSDFVALLFPELCYACNNSLVAHEDLICTECLYNLPYTDFHHQPDNIVAKQFWGKVKLDGAYALCYFTKGGKVQQLVHSLKYRNAPQIGNKLGALAGQRMAESTHFKHFDAVIPVPLHKSRLRKRGYNQSRHFAEGIAEALGTVVSINDLIRTKATQTQTHKTRFERSANMKEVFAVKDVSALTNKHVLLVDDVVTTGATLESCANVLLAIPGLKLSIATIAYAE